MQYALMVAIFRVRRRGSPMGKLSIRLPIDHQMDAFRTGRFQATSPSLPS